MMPFDPPTRLDDSEKQFLRDNKNNELMRIIKKLIKSAAEEVEVGYLKKPEHKTEDLLVLKGEKLMANAIFNLINAHSSEPFKPEEKKPSQREIK